MVRFSLTGKCLWAPHHLFRFTTWSGTPVPSSGEIPSVYLRIVTDAMQFNDSYRYQ